MKKSETKKVEIGTLTTEMASAESLPGNSMLNYLPNPDPILKAQGGRIQVYRDMRDAHLRSVRGKRKGAVSAKTWSLQSDKGDCGKAKLIETHLWNLNLRNPIREIMGAVDYGYQVTEVVWKAIDGIWLPAALKGRQQELFKFSKKGELIFASEKNGAMPQYKFLLTQYESSASNPYGEPALADCFWPVALKKGGLKWWTIFTEKFGMPKVIGKTSPSTNDADRNKFLKMLYGMVRDAAAVINDNDSVSLLETKFSGETPFEPLVRWADREMSKAYLGETLTTEQTDSGGTRALGEVHNEVRLEMTQDDLAMVEGTMNTLIKWIWELNWPDDKEIPWFQFAQPKDMQMGQIAKDKEIHGMGVDFTPEYFSDTYGINIKYIAGVRSGQQGAMFAEGEPRAKQEEPQGRKQAEKFAAALSEKCSNMNLTKPIHELVKNAQSLEEIRDGLIGLYAEMPMDDIAEELEQAFLAADLTGRMEILRKAGLA